MFSYDAILVDTPCLPLNNYLQIYARELAQNSALPVAKNLQKTLHACHDICNTFLYLDRISWIKAKKKPNFY